MRLRENPIYRLEMRRWRSILPPGSVKRRLAIAAIVVLLAATVFAHAFPWPYHRAWMKVQLVTGYLVYPLYFIPGVVPGLWHPMRGGLHRLPELATTPLADLFYPSNLIASLAPPLLLGNYVSRLRRQGVAEQLILTGLRGSEIVQGLVWAKLLPLLLLIVVCYGYIGASAISPLGPLFPLRSSSDQSGVALHLICLGATRVALCVQAIAASYVALGVSARFARTRFGLPVSLLLCTLCIPAAAYSFGSGIAYRIWDWLNQHGWYTAPFMGAVWRCELLKIGLIFVFYLALWWLAKGAATLEIERLSGVRRTRWRL